MAARSELLLRPSLIDAEGERDRMEPEPATALGIRSSGAAFGWTGSTSGHVADVVLNPSLTQVVGLDVTQAGAIRFIPWMLFREEGADLALITADAFREHSTIGLILQHGVRLSRVPQAPASDGGVERRARATAGCVSGGGAATARMLTRRGPAVRRALVILSRRGSMRRSLPAVGLLVLAIPGAAGAVVAATPCR